MAGFVDKGIYFKYRPGGEPTKVVANVITFEM